MLPPVKGVAPLHGVSTPQGHVLPGAGKLHRDKGALLQRPERLPVEGQGQGLPGEQVAAIAVRAQKEQVIAQADLLRLLDDRALVRRGVRARDLDGASRDHRPRHLPRVVQDRQAGVYGGRKDAHVEAIVARGRARGDGELQAVEDDLARTPLRRRIVKEGLLCPAKAEVVDQVDKKGQVGAIDRTIDVQVEGHVRRAARHGRGIEVIAQVGQGVAHVHVRRMLRRGHRADRRVQPECLEPDLAVGPAFLVERRLCGQISRAEHRIDGIGVVIDEDRRPGVGRRQDQRPTAHPADPSIVARVHGERGVLLKIRRHIGIGLRMAVQQRGGVDQRLVPLIVGARRCGPGQVAAIGARALIADQEDQEQSGKQGCRRPGGHRRQVDAKPGC